MIHPAAELRFIDEQIGFGVFARAFIPRGTITWAIDSLDQALAPAQFDKMPSAQRESVEKYVFGDAAGNWVLCWDLARFVNHSCASTCRNVGARFDIAIRDIQPGEQITSDYAELNAEAFDCLCGSPQCRGRIEAEDRARFQAKWQLQVAQTLPLVRTVPQPLWDFVAKDPLFAKV